MGAATRDEVARLLGRAAFGATAADLNAWVGKPYTALVDHLLDVPPLESRPSADEARRASIEQSGKYETDRTGGFVGLAQQWWLERMRNTAYPLEERMTLFWHGHFATSVRDPFPDVAMVMGQNQSMRRNALGNFRELVYAMTLDSAMLEWLDGARNAIPLPNENYARELLELFTLGKYPQVYTEGDVREAARVLTGWTNDTFFRKASFNAAMHDKGTKRVLGRTITNQGDAEFRTLIDTALGQPISPLFIAYKLVANFAYAPPLMNLLTQADSLVARVAQTLRSTNWNIRAAVRTLLLSDEFRIGDPSQRHQLVRQPAEVALGAAKALNFSLDDDTVRQRVWAMGQPLFVPPNVGGWPVGTGWLSPATVLARYDFAVLAQTKATVPLPASSDYDGWARLFGMAPLTRQTTDAISGYIASQPKAPEAARQAAMVILVLSSPEWTVM